MQIEYSTQELPDDAECHAPTNELIAANPPLWNADLGEV